MKIQTIFRMSSPYRDDFRVKAYIFGEGAKTLCIVGTMRGDEMQQQYVASRLVGLLQRAEEEGRLSPGVCISVIPSVNPFSINIEKRFWALDNTDINRMFPGYDKGETTQRIASGVFEYIKDFSYGIQLASFYLPGNFLPHVSMIKTGFEDVEDARLFGFPYVAVRNPQPIDTVLLNYNWQIWETRAFSLFAGTTDVIDVQAAEACLDAIRRFMAAKEMAQLEVRSEGEKNPVLIEGQQLVTVQAPHAGILLVDREAGAQVQRGEIIARIMHPYEGRIVCNVESPVDGTIFFARNKSIAFQNTLLFRIIER